MIDVPAATAAIRAALDDVLARGGFRWNEVHVSPPPVALLYEALPDEVMQRVPGVAPYLGDLEEALCLDLWIAYDDGVIQSMDLEGRPVTSVLREFGHETAAAVIEGATDLDAQLAAYAAGFETLFATPG